MTEEGISFAGDLVGEGSDISRASVYRTPEGRLLLMGIALAIAFIVWVVTSSAFSGEKGGALASLAATEILAGRAATLTLGYSLGLGDKTVIAVSIVLETILVLIFYPLFVFSWQHLLEIRWLKSSFGSVHRAAENHKNKVRKYGIMGLFVFVWLPFWMTGPAVGCVIGFMLGLRVWTNISVVLAGTYVATLGWALLLRRFHEQAASYNRYAGLIVVLAITATIAVGQFLRCRRQNKNAAARENCDVPAGS